MALKNPRAGTPVRRQSVTLKSEDPIVRTAKLIQNRAGYFEIVYSEPRGGKGLGWRSRTLSTRTQDRAEAQRELDRFIDRAIEKSQPTVALDQLTVEDACRAYITARPQQEASLRQARRHLGHLKISELTAETLHRWREAFAGYEPNSVRRYLGALKGALNHARKTGQTSLAPYVDMPPAGAARTKWLTREQLALVRDKVTEYAAACAGARAAHALKLFVFLASSFGARQEAILELTWDRVDWAHKTLDFRNPLRAVTKKRRAIVALSDEASLFLREAYLQAGRPGGTTRVVEISNRTLKRVYTKFFTAIGFGWCTSHVFRHTLATHLLQDGESIYHVAQLLADTVTTVEKTYAHVVPNDLRAVVERRKLGW